MRPESMTVLAVEDDSGDAELLRRELGYLSELKVDFVHVPTVTEAKAALSRIKVDLTFIDYRLGSETGIEFVQNIRASGDLRPIICLTGQGDEHIATNALHAGADEYLAKSDLGTESLRRAIAMSAAHSQKRQLEAQNQLLLKQLQTKNAMLESNGRRLAEMYETAHQFVDDVSHEFRTPLTVIKEFSSILLDGIAGTVNAEQRQYLGIVLNRVDDLSAMVDDMLDISKLEAGLLGMRRKVCRIEEVLEHIRTTLERKAALRNLTLEIVLGDKLPPVYCDPEKVGRVMINLVGNALKFSGDQANVRLSVLHDSSTAELLVKVEDHGPGIHPDSVNALFERFSQIGTPSRSAIKGFGLGLNISKDLVHLNFGDIGVESKVGSGSTFSFTVPTADPSRLIRRYLKRVGDFRDGAEFVSLVSAHVAATIRSEVQDQIEQFLHQFLRSSDLVFRTQPNQWLMVLTTNRPDLDAYFRRMEDAWRDSNRNDPVAQLPVIDLSKEGTWELKVGADCFLEHFDKKCLLQEFQNA